MAYCPNCRSPVGSADNFCRKCGGELSTLPFSFDYSSLRNYSSSLPSRNECPRCGGTGKVPRFHPVGQAIFGILTLGTSAVVFGDETVTCSRCGGSGYTGD